MKKLILFTIMALIGTGSAMAQSSSEVFVGYSFLKQDVKTARGLVKRSENTDSHGFTAGYSRFFQQTKVVGVTGEVGANFDDNKASLVTAMGGVIFKANQEKTVKPFAKALIGYAKQKVERSGILDTADVSKAYSLGAGFDYVINKDLQWRIGADYINTGFGGKRQDAVKFSTGLVF